MGTCHRGFYAPPLGNAFPAQFADTHVGERCVYLALDASLRDREIVVAGGIFSREIFDQTEGGLSFPFRQRVIHPPLAVLAPLHQRSH